GGKNAWLNIYGMMSLSRLRFYSESMRERLGDHNPYADLEPNIERMRRWHPLNRGSYLAGRVHLAGLLMNAKGDRVAMHSSVETRYPFLDEEVFDFLAKLHPRWKMRGFTDKYILRRVAERVLLEMGLVGVIATQLWHQTFIDGSLADLPNLANRPSSLVNGQGPRRRGFAPTVMH